MGGPNSISGPISDALPQLLQNETYRNVAGPNGLASAGAALLLVTAVGMHHPGRILQLMHYGTLLLPTTLALHLALARIRPPLDTAAGRWRSPLLTRRLQARPECRRNGRSCYAQPNATVRRAFLQAAGWLTKRRQPPNAATFSSVK